MLWRLRALKSISLAHNHLVTLPLAVLLSSVTALDLSYNKITALLVEAEEDACALVADAGGRGEGGGGGGGPAHVTISTAAAEGTGSGDGGEGVLIEHDQIACAQAGGARCRGGGGGDGGGVVAGGLWQAGFLQVAVCCCRVRFVCVGVVYEVGVCWCGLSCCAHTHTRTHTHRH